MNGGSSGSTPTIDKPSDVTLDKIDFVIQGLENGLFKEISEKIDFHQKLKGEDPSRFVKSLIDVIELQKWQIADLHEKAASGMNERIELDNRIREIESTLTNHTRDMRGIASGLAKLARPDPFDMDYSANVDTAATEQFINEYKSKY